MLGIALIRGQDHAFLGVSPIFFVFFLFASDIAFNKSAFRSSIPL
jgi:hypothetical protein